MPTFTIEQIDRTIFEIIRKKIVSYGYLPDWRTTAGANQNDKQTNFNAAKDAIRMSKGFVIDVFGVGAGVSRDAKKTASIVINRTAISPVKSGFGLYYFEESLTQINGQNSYNQKQLADSVAISYEIRYISETIAQERVCVQALIESLGTSQKYVGAINLSTFVLDGEKFPIRVLGNTNVSGSIEFIENIFQIVVPEVVIYENELIVGGITAQTHIVVGLNTQNESDILSPQTTVNIE